MLYDLISLVRDFFIDIYDLFPMAASGTFLDAFIYPFLFCVFCTIMVMPVCLIIRVVNKLR